MRKEERGESARPIAKESKPVGCSNQAQHNLFFCGDDKATLDKVLSTARHDNRYVCSICAHAIDCQQRFLLSISRPQFCGVNTQRPFSIKIRPQKPAILTGEMAQGSHWPLCGLGASFGLSLRFLVTFEASPFNTLNARGDVQATHSTTTRVCVQAIPS